MVPSQKENAMFYLKDLPTDTSLQEFSRLYPNMNPSAIKSCADLLRTGSELLTTFETILGRHNLSQGRFLTLIVMNRDPDVADSPSNSDFVSKVRRALSSIRIATHYNKS